MKIYSIKEAAKITGLSVRWLQKKCQAINLEKVNGIYQISDYQISQWKGNKKNVLKTSDAVTDVSKENTIKNSQTSDAVTDAVTDVKRVYDVDNTDEVIVRLTPDEYDELTQLVNNKKLTDERILDYKNEIQYLRNSLDKSHEQFGILLKKMEQSLSLLAQRNWIEAIEKKKDQNFDITDDYESPPY